MHFTIIIIIVFLGLGGLRPVLYIIGGLSPLKHPRFPPMLQTQTQNTK
jgi:hypothetical protein